MSEVLVESVEPLPYDPDWYIELVRQYIYSPDDMKSEDRQRLLDDAKLQLQSDVVSLRPQLSTTFEGLLATDEITAAWHMAHWEERGFAHGGFGRPIPGEETRRVGGEALEYLQAKIQETAQANNWEAFFPKRDHSVGNIYGAPGDLSWRMEQSTYIFDGEHFALIGPTLFQVDRAALGDTEYIEWLGPSHLRKYAEVRTVLPVEGDRIDDHSLRKGTFKLQDGQPEGVPTQKELAFLEQVLAAYY